MAESAYHMKLVNMIEKYVKDNFEILHSFILTDKAESKTKPFRTFDGFCPDLYYCFENVFIIGEAKTVNDIERQHSINQYKSYINEAISFSGDAYLIFCVPWSEVYTLKSILVNIKPKTSFFKIIIISDLGGIITL